MSEIMPCPHCGMSHPIVDNYQQSARVVCTGCCTSGPLMPAEADAIRAWNRLALAVQIAEAAWLERFYCGYDCLAGRPNQDRLDEVRDMERCLEREKRRLVYAWGAMDGSQEGQP